MSQVVFSDINPAATSGSQLATLLNSFRDAVISSMSGTSRPTEILAGGGWLDTTNDPTSWTFKIWTGTVDISVFTLNLSTGLAGAVGADTEFDITKVVASATGPILKFIKKRVASNGQVTSGDTIGEIQFVGTTNTPTSPVVCRIKSIASDTMTSSANGAYLVFEGTTATSTAILEQMRLKDGFLGIGTTAPDSMVHAVGATGIKTDYAADDANGAVLTFQKSRVASSGKVLSGDAIAKQDFKSTDVAGTKFVAAEILVETLEDHTATLRGTKATFKGTTTGTNTLASRAVMGDEWETVVQHKLNAELRVSQNVSTAATIAALDASKVVVEMTGSTATSIQGINAAQASKVIAIHNRSSATVTLSHEDGTATATNRIKLPASTSINIPAQGSAELYYCTTDTRWKLKALALGDPSNTNAIRTSEALSSTPRALSNADNGKIFLCDTGALNINAHASPSTDMIITIKDRGLDFSVTNMNFVPNGSQKIEGLNATYAMAAKKGKWTFQFDGTDWNLI